MSMFGMPLPYVTYESLGDTRTAQQKQRKQVREYNKEKKSCLEGMCVAGRNMPGGGEGVGSRRPGEGHATMPPACMFGKREGHTWY